MAFQGTVVTIENFLAWKAGFDLEINELRKTKQKEEEQGSKAKLTGMKSLKEVPIFLFTAGLKAVPRLFRPSNYFAP